MSADAHPRDRLKRELSLGDAIFLIVAAVIGSGIFFTPGRVAELLPNPGWIFAAWIAGALLSCAGALANAELGAMFPRAGGDYVYLREAFHPLAGFLVGWISFFAIYAGSVATLAAAFAAGCVELFGWSETARVPIAIGITLAVSGLNVIGVRWGARVNNVTSVLKVGALVTFAVLGPLFGEGDPARLFTTWAGAGSISFAAFGLAMSPVLFTYLGWNSSLYVASEIRDPVRNLPRSLFIGLAVCAGVYLVVNAVYLYALPPAMLVGVENAGAAAAGALFGGLGGRLVAIFVLISVLGTLNATVLIGPRIAYAMSLDGLFFRGVDRVSDAFHTPVVAIAIQAAVAAVLLGVLRTFPSALDFTTFAILVATIADVLALYRLRITQPERPRPYRAWGTPWVPGMYLVANVGIAAALVAGRPLECAIGLGMLVVGLPFYFFFTRETDAA